MSSPPHGRQQPPDRSDAGPAAAAVPGSGGRGRRERPKRARRRRLPASHAQAHTESDDRAVGSRSPVVFLRSVFVDVLHGRERPKRPERSAVRRSVSPWRSGLFARRGNRDVRADGDEPRSTARSACLLRTASLVSDSPSVVMVTGRGSLCGEVLRTHMLRKRNISQEIDAEILR